VSIHFWFRRSLILLITAATGFAQTADEPRRGVTDPGVITTRQAITPAGVPMVFQGRVYGVSFGATDAALWILTSGSVFGSDWRQNHIFARYRLQGNPGFQGIAFDSSGKRALVAARFKDRDSASVRMVAIGSAGEAAAFEPKLGSVPAGGLVLSNDGTTVIIPLVSENRAAIIATATGSLRGIAPTGIAPVSAALNHDGTIAYVSNWGGRNARESDLTAPTGYAPLADRVVIDKSGIASNGSVTRIDLRSMRPTHQLAVGLHPVSLAWDESHKRLFVANNNSDSISVIDTGTNELVRTIPVQPFGHSVRGIAPTALALTPDGKTLFVACGGINAVAQIESANGTIDGLIPSGWYPNSVAVSPEGKHLAIGSLLGVGSGWRDAPAKRFVHSYRGSVAVLPVPDKAQLASFTTAVLENNHLPTQVNPTRTALRADAAPKAVPVRVGEPSPIEHVVFIIKENRTYDQVFGDVPEGNGDPSLVMFGGAVTPNLHRLARQYVLLDNFYATGGNSADGHQWLTQANESGYALWQGYEGRSYPFDGSDPLAPAATGFLWDLAMSRHKTVRVYGEYAGKMDQSKLPRRSELLGRWSKGEDFSREWHVTAPIRRLNDILSASYPSYSTVIPDVIRAQLLIADIREWDKKGSMPNLVMAALPSDHTAGTDPAFTTPRAMVADNDLAVGRIVEALSHTRFWKNMAIFIVEDDAQNGVDHVDGHRTVALAVSPYVRRSAVDSTFYSHQSILKTIELMLGLPTLSIFDLIASDMRASFVDEPDFTPYDAVKNSQSLFESNPPVSSLHGAARRAALDSMKMRWDTPDAAPTEKLNRILWRQVRGWTTPYPAPRSGAFAPLSLEVEDHER
jgi:YVTN family beta-propeller protein